MKAALLFKTGAPLEIVDVTVDKPAPDEVLVRTVASGLCHSDYSFMAGLMPSPRPALFGHESAGVVEQVGENVRSVKPGDAVVGTFSASCGFCPQCMSGHGQRCDDKPGRAPDAFPRLRYKDKPVYQFTGLGGFAEQMLVHERAVVKLPPEMPLDRAALLGCAVLTGVGAVLCRAEMRPGQTAAVVGCGGVGLNVIQGARIAGASRIIAIDTNPAKLEMAQAFGATDRVHGGPDAVEAVNALVPGGVDHAFEVVGIPETARQALLMLGKGGRLTLIGMGAMTAEMSLPFGPFIGKEVEVVGTTAGSATAALMVPDLVRYYLDGRLQIDPLISQHIALEDINRGYDQLIAGETTRSVIMFGT